MNTAIDHFAAPQPLLSASARIAAAIGVTAVVALAWLGAEQASQQAVQNASESIARGATYITLPSVEIVGRRDTATVKSQPGRQHA